MNVTLRTYTLTDTQKSAPCILTITANEAAARIAEMSAKWGKPIAHDAGNEARFRFNSGKQAIFAEVEGITVNDLRAVYKGAGKPAPQEEAPKMAANLPAPVPGTARHRADEVCGLTFTVEFADGNYATIRVRHGEGTFEGKRIIDFLSGPDNERDFTGFAFLTDLCRVQVWKRYKDDNGKPVAKMRKYAEAAEIVVCADSLGQFTEAYATVSGRCARCGHKLTVPASLKRGLGPDCAEALGF